MLKVGYAVVREPFYHQGGVEVASGGISIPIVNGIAYSGYDRMAFDEYTIDYWNGDLPAHLKVKGNMIVRSDTCSLDIEVVLSIDDAQDIFLSDDSVVIRG